MQGVFVVHGLLMKILTGCDTMFNEIEIRRIWMRGLGRGAEWFTNIAL